MSNIRRCLQLSVAPLLATVLLAGAVKGQDCEEETAPELAVFFGNGMFNTRKEAHLSAVSLWWNARPLLRDHVSDPEAVRYGLVYNEDEGLLEQVWEVAKQRREAEHADFWRYLAGLRVVPRWLEEAIHDLVEGARLETWTNDTDLAAHVSAYEELIDAGARVVTVAHSQGNLYANGAYRALSADYQPHFGVVSVATPAPTVEGATGILPYTTFEEDKIIAAVRVAYPSTLPGNATTEGNDVPFMAHGFLDAYFNVRSARQAILDNLVMVQASLEQPEAPEEPVQVCESEPPTNSDADCETGNPWAGTCLESFFGSCWDADGACTASSEGTNSTLTYENGATYETLLDVSDPDNIRGDVILTGSSGGVCATGESIASGPSLPAGCSALVTYHSENGELTMCADPTGGATVTCPDGSTFTRTAEQFACAFGSPC